MDVTTGRCCATNQDWTDCRRPAKVERDGKLYCLVHDPVAREERKLKRASKGLQERWRRAEVVERILVRANALINAIGHGGRPEYMHGRFTGNIVLRERHAEALVAELKELREIKERFENGDGRA